MVQNASDDVITQIDPKITNPAAIMTGPSRLRHAPVDTATTASATTSTTMVCSSVPARRSANSWHAQLEQRAERAHEELVEAPEPDVPRRELDLADEDVAERRTPTPAVA